MKKILFLIIFLVFIAGCAEEGVKVVKVTPGEEARTITPSPEPNQTPSAPATTPAATTNTTSNATSAPVAQGTSTKADLEITNFFLSSLNAGQNEAFEIKFKIKNAGSAEISNFEYSVKIMKGNNVVKTDIYNYTQVLGVGTTTDRMELSYFLSDTGSYDIIVKLDPFNAFAEPKETNNEGKQKINIVEGNKTTTGSATNTSSGSCTDSDGGKVYNTKGSCSDSVVSNMQDICIDVNELWEVYCDSDSRCAFEKEHTCYCQEGKCV